MPLKARDFSLIQAATWLGISRHTLVKALEQRQAIYHDGSFGIRPHQSFIDRGLLRLESRSTYINGSKLKSYHFTSLTIKGLAWIAEELEQATRQAS